MVAAVAAAAFACRPQPGLGSVALARGGKLHLVDLATCRDRVLVRRGVQGGVRFVDGGRTLEYGYGRWIVPVAGGTPRKQGAASGLASPDGRSVADVVVHRLGPKAAVQTIVVRTRGSTHNVYAVHESYAKIPGGMPGPVGLVAWSPDARWLFFFIDPMNSASIAADGLTLQVVPAAGGTPHDVALGLLNADYRAWCGRTLVMTAGGDRIATAPKRLVAASAPGWAPRLLVRASGHAWGSLDCAPDGRSVVVQSQPASMNADFFATHWSLWRVGLDGAVRRLTSPPSASTDQSPRFSRDGRTILFVRSHKGAGKLYALRGGRLLGPLLSLGYGPGYYGHADWWQAAAWSLGGTR